MRRIILGTAVLVLAGTGLALAGATRSDSEVKVKAVAGKADASGKQKVVITLTINDPWYVYANPVGNEDFASAKTQITILGKEELKSVEVNYPKGKVKEYPGIGKFGIYEKKVDIEAVVQRAAGDTAPLNVRVRFQACNPKGQCLLPATVQLKVP